MPWRVTGCIACQKEMTMKSEPSQPACLPSGLPPAQGLYDPRFEKDACGVGFVVNIKGEEVPPDRPPGHDGAGPPQPPRRLRL